MRQGKIFIKMGRKLLGVCKPWFMWGYLSDGVEDEMDKTGELLKERCSLVVGLSALRF